MSGENISMKIDNCVARRERSHYVPCMRKGWHSRGYLPHCDCNELVQHIVFRLHDSLPGDVLDQLKGVAPSQRRAFIQAALDKGHGGAHLREHAAARIVADAIRFFDETRYRLYAWCVMPSHVHVVAEPYDGLGAIVRSWKAYTAARINALLGLRGRLWAHDYFDRFMRTDEQLQTTIAYVERNPVTAGLCARPEDWPFSSASEQAASDRAPSGAHPFFETSTTLRA
jgi:REP element-mobilizing transposase RayT